MIRRARARPDRGTRAVVLAVDDGPVALATLEAELGKRYGEDYDVWCEASPALALCLLQDFKEVGQPVALVLASHRMADLLGTELLGRATNSTPPPSGACSSAGVTGRQQSRCCRPWPSASSTTTCPNRRHRPTRASTRSSRASWPLGQAARPRVHTDRCTGHRHAAASTATGRGPPMRRCRRRVADPSFLS